MIQSFSNLIQFDTCYFFQACIVSNIGGSSLDDAIKSIMKFILSNNLGRLCNLSGQSGKVCFSKLEIFDVVCGMLSYSHNNLEICV